MNKTSKNFSKFELLKAKTQKVVSQQELNQIKGGFTGIVSSNESSETDAPTFTWSTWQP